MQPGGKLGHGWSSISGGMLKGPQHSCRRHFMTGPAPTVLLLALCFVLTPVMCASAGTPKLWHLANDVTYFVKTGNFTQVGRCSTPSRLHHPFDDGCNLRLKLRWVFRHTFDDLMKCKCRRQHRMCRSHSASRGSAASKMTPQTLATGCSSRQTPQS